MWNALFPDGGLEEAENPNFPDIPVEYLGRYDKIALELETDPIIVALLDNLGIMFACGNIAVCDKVTEAIGRFVDIVKGDYNTPPEKWQELPDDDFPIYVIKPEFQKFFEKRTNISED